jgi:lambda family phage portal protein
VLRDASLLDRAIELVSPRTALRRAQARVALGQVRAYEAATLGRRGAGWNPGGGTSSMELGFGLARIRNRARQMFRDNEYALAAIDARVSNAVGTGITVRPVDARERAVWDAWWSTKLCDADDVLNGPALTRLIDTHLEVDGEVLIRRRLRRPEDGLEIPLQLQVLEADHLDESRTGVIEGRLCILGIAHDALGRRVGYYLFREHPGELATASMPRRDSVFVPASEVLHVFDRRRASQIRGVSRLATSLMRLRNLADYEDAELVRKKIEACFVAMVTTDSDTTHLTGDLVQLDGNSRKAGEKVSPGMIKYLRPGESVDFGDPTPSAGGGEFTRRQLHAIAAGAGITYAQLTGDMSQANFASNRMGLIQFRQLIDQHQWLVLVPQVIEPIRAWFREAAFVAGRIGAPNGAHKITMPRRHYVDPLKDAQAAKEETRGGSMSLSEVIRERGDDPDEVFAEIAAERKKLADLGIVVDSDAAVPKAGGPAADAAEPAAAQGAP